MAYTLENDYRHAITAEQRAKAIRAYFGWNGATIHQLAEATGLTAHDILYRPLVDGDRLSSGFSAVRTCDVEWRRDTIAPKVLGDWPFWRDVIGGYWMTDCHAARGAET